MIRVLRGEKTLSLFDVIVRNIKIGNPGNRNTKRLEGGVLEVDILLVLVFDDARGLYAPNWRAVRIRLARLTGRDHCFFVNSLVAFFVSVGCGDARVVLRKSAQRTQKAIAEIALQRQPVRIDHGAICFLETDITDGRERISLLVVNHFIREKDVLILIKLDITSRDNAMVLVVVDEII